MLPKHSPLCRLCPSEGLCYLCLLGGFPWCNDSLCPRIASLDLDTETVEVEEVEPDWRIVAQYERVEKQLLSQLDSLLEDVRGEQPQPQSQLLPSGCEGLLWGPERAGERAGDSFLWITRTRSAPKASLSSL